MHVLFVSIFTAGVSFKVSTFPNILTGVGCIYLFFVFETTALYHGYFSSFLTFVPVGFLDCYLFLIQPHYLSTRFFIFRISFLVFHFSMSSRVHFLFGWYSSYCPVTFCLVLVASLLIVLWAWCRYTHRICLFAALRPISIILIYTLGRAWFNSCFWCSMNAFAVALGEMLWVKLFNCF